MSDEQPHDSAWDTGCGCVMAIFATVGILSIAAPVYHFIKGTIWLLLGAD